MPPNNNKRPSMPVMDIQTPKPQPPASPNPSLSRPATLEYTRPRPNDPTAPSFSPDQNPARIQSANSQNIAKQKKRSKLPLILGIGVVFIMLGAMGAGGYYYFKIYKKPAPAPVATQPAPQEQPAEQQITATPEGVDQAVQTIDQNLNSLNDDKDYNANDLSDNALGL